MNFWRVSKTLLGLSSVEGYITRSTIRISISHAVIVIVRDRDNYSCFDGRTEVVLLIWILFIFKV